ncbi:hypothetical protein NEOKW01_0621 [Nematocida sp. AWRm80]|nr:hypothetical protein NEOKW01_0621 [Nematocida sp. AWRm80]
MIKNIINKLSNTTDTTLINSVLYTYLNNSYNTQLFLLYLKYNPGAHCVKYAYNTTFYDIYSLEIKIKYLELLTETEIELELERLKMVPIIGIEILFKLHKHEYNKINNLEVFINKYNYDSTVYGNSNVNITVYSSINSVISILEFMLTEYKENKLNFNVLLYNLNLQIENKSRLLNLFKCILVKYNKLKHNHSIDRNIDSSISIYGNNKIKNTIYSNILLLLTLNSSNIDKHMNESLDKNDKVTDNNDVYYIVILSNILKYKGIIHFREYLSKIVGRIGYKAFLFAMHTEGAFSKDANYVLGIALMGIKSIIQADISISSNNNLNYIINNIDKISVNNIMKVNLIISESINLILSLNLNDKSKIQILTNIYKSLNSNLNHNNINKNKIINPNSQETDCVLLASKHKILYEQTEAIYPLLETYSLREIYKYIKRIYSMYSVEDQEEEDSLDEDDREIEEYSEDLNITTNPNYNNITNNKNRVINSNPNKISNYNITCGDSLNYINSIIEKLPKIESNQNILSNISIDKVMNLLLAIEL